MSPSILASFKSGIFNCYKSALAVSYDCEDPRSFKSICLKCNSARPLFRPATCCQQLVVVKGEASDWLTVTSGVPQGSLLGPLFFIVYINDLPGVISKDSSIALYADDSKMYRVISTQEDLSTFQSDIDKISDWCKMNKTRINTKKCKIMRITRKKVTISWGV